MVQELWSAFEDRGVAGVMERAGDDVQWSPGLAGGRSMDTREAAEFFDQRGREGVTVQARPYRFEQHGSCVIVTGSLRIREHGGFAESLRVWLFRFADGRLMGAEQYPSHAEARAACDG